MNESHTKSCIDSFWPMTDQCIFCLIQMGHTWRIIPGLVSGEELAHFQAMMGHLEGVPRCPTQGLTITMVINHLQVLG